MKLDSETPTINTFGIGLETLVGINTKGGYPVDRGNCFSLITEDHIEFRIVNFYVENLRYLLKKKIISWPVKIHKLSKTVVIIHDSRIPIDFYNTEWCETCCPYSLLPINQQLRKKLKIESGEIVIKDNIEIRKIMSQKRKLKADWIITTDMDVVSLFEMDKLIRKKPLDK